jgi:YHS domain-containing protein
LRIAVFARREHSLDRLAEHVREVDPEGAPGFGGGGAQADAAARFVVVADRGRVDVRHACTGAVEPEEREAVFRRQWPVDGLEVVGAPTALSGLQDPSRGPTHEDGRFKTLQALVHDPVCGMLLDPQQAPARLDEEGRILYFCSRGFRGQYEQERGRQRSTALV